MPAAISPNLMKTIQRTGIVVMVALLLAIPAFVNRLPVLFPDTVGYNRAGEATLAALGRLVRPAASRPVAVPFARQTPDNNADDKGISNARSPYYGIALAAATRAGGVWFAASVQALAAAVALMLAVRRLGLVTPGPVYATAALAAIGGLGFFSVTLVPDLFLGPELLALAFLPTMRLPRVERFFWMTMLLAGMLFHRGFLAVALVLVVGLLVFRHRPWFIMRGWITALILCILAAAGHTGVGLVTERVLHQRMVTPPFLLARMASSPVLLAHLDEACPTRRYLLCRFRARLPMTPNVFLWYRNPIGLFHDLSIADRARIGDEATPMIARAVAARPGAAMLEAINLSARQFGFVGMSDFNQRIIPGITLDPAISRAMPAYERSGIRRGDFPLRAAGRVVEAVYFAALGVAVAAGIVLVRRRSKIADGRIVAAAAIIIAGLVVNAAVNATLAGVFDRYQGRVVWLAVVAAAAVAGQATRVFRSSRPLSVTTKAGAATQV